MDVIDRESSDCIDKNETAEDVWKYVKSRGERYAFETVQLDVSTGERLNFVQLSKNVESFASALADLNLPSGIGICSENNIEYCWILLGALRARVRCTLMSPSYTARELRHFLNLAKPDIVLCSKFVRDKFYENGESFRDVCSEFGFVQKLYVWGMIEVNFAYESLSSLMRSDTDKRRPGIIGNRINFVEKQPSPNAGDEEALILASSGSTGLAKGVVLTHRAIVESLKLSAIYARSGETALGLMPFFHAYGLILSLMCLCEGSNFMIVPKFLGAKYLSDVIAGYQIKNLYLIPSLLATIGKCPTFTKEKLACVKHVWTSAARVSSVIQKLAVEKLSPDAVLHHCYGMTETTFVAMTGTYEKPESPGKVVPNIECKVIRGDKVCGPNEVGELCFRGPSIMKGYLNNEEATSEALQTDGWLRSGDLGYRDEDGYFFIVDRIKEMIKYQGNQVSPTEIEEIILELPDVLEVLVVGMPNEDFGELPAAGIVTKKDSVLTADEVKEHVAKQVSSHKKLRGGIFFLDELPKTGTGKLKRKALLALINDILHNSSSQDR